jgi:lipopolysaccharide export system protein LptA
MTTLLSLAFAIASCAPDAPSRPSDTDLRATDALVESPGLRLRADRLAVRGGPVLGALLGAAPAPLPREGAAIDVRADEVTLEPRRHVARFEGNVRLERGSAAVSCRRLVAETGEHGELRHARAEGDVRVETGNLTASAPVAELDLVAGLVSLSGGVTIERADARLESDSVDLRLDGGQVVLRRVRGTFRFPAPR